MPDKQRQFFNPPLHGQIRPAGEVKRENPITEDAVVGGRLRLQQPARGHRVGHDAILLAAACPARAGERAVDLGAGVGALVEIDSRLAALAAENARLNGLAARIDTVVLDVGAPARAIAAAGLGADSIARVLMNPPFNDPRRQRSSPDRQRRLAHVAARETLVTWIRTAARLLRPRGTLSLIWRADGLADVLAALGPAFGAVTVMPVHPKPGEPAVRILVRAAKASRGPLALLPGLILTDRSGSPTADAEAVLREGAALSIADA